ncbi:MAG: hypothetical protein ACK4S2_05480 [Gemmobacter sp.]|uniref:hypothetical protein n=1 Tax=Gemmobacter sp. TaxID=1898957 RepID=UPI00391B2B72
MRKLLLVPVLLLPLAGCMQDPLSRGAGGAVAGAVIADATGGNAITGAVIGGLAGAATCGVNLGLPPCRPRY